MYEKGSPMPDDVRDGIMISKIANLKKGINEKNETIKHLFFPRMSSKRKTIKKDSACSLNDECEQ